MSDHALFHGRRIVITRPTHQAASISQRLIHNGATVCRFPLLSITQPQDTVRRDHQLATLATYDYVIFTSPNAVLHSLPLLPDSLIGSVKVAAVGRQTAAVLSDHGVTVSVVPDQYFNSEALLERLPQHQVASTSIAIIRGEGGRSLLYDTLQQRGAAVDYIEVYRRTCPAVDLSPLLAFHREGGLDMIVLTSADSLQHLFRLAGVDAPWLQQVGLLVGSRRIAEQLKKKAHCGELLIAEDPSDETIYRCLTQWAQNKN